MSWLSELFGGGKRKDIARGRANATAALDKYYGQGRDVTEQWHDRSMRFLQPQLEAGGRALESEQAALGLLGPERQAEFQRSYVTSPGYQAKLDERVKTVTLDNARRGLALSGRQLRQVADEGEKTLSEDYNKYLDRVVGLSERGRQTSTNAAQMTAATGQDLAKSFYGQGGTLANIEFQTGAANANTRFTLGDLAGVIGAAARVYAAI